MNLRDIPEINELMNKIEDVQNKDWNGACSCKGCYWNMWNPKYKNYNNEESKICVSESLDEIVMNPNSKECEGYYSFREACGKSKEDL